jgi:hypothetical protein
MAHSYISGFAPALGGISWVSIFVFDPDREELPHWQFAIAYSDDGARILTPD